MNPIYSYTPAQHWRIRWIEYLWLKTKTDVAWTGNTLSSCGTDCKTSRTTATWYVGTWQRQPQGDHHCGPTPKGTADVQEGLFELKSVKLKTLKTTINLPEQSRNSYLFFSSPQPFCTRQQIQKLEFHFKLISEMPKGINFSPCFCW